MIDPEKLIMMSMAVMIDIGALIFTALGLGDIVSPVFDWAGLILIGGWILFRTGKTKGMKKKGKKVLKRAVIPFLIESVPILGDIAFTWIYAVYKETKAGKEKKGKKIKTIKKLK